MVSPRASYLPALPKAWTPGTNGPVRGEVIGSRPRPQQDLEAFRGKVAGKILLLSEARDFNAAGTRGRSDGTSPLDLSEHYSREDLQRIASYEIRDPNRPRRSEFAQRFKLRTAIREFAQKEKALATIEVERRGRRHRGGERRRLLRPPEESTGVPALVMAAEHYNRLVRMIHQGEKLEVAVDLAAQFHDDDLMATTPSPRSPAPT